MRIPIDDIEIEFGIKKCAMLIMKNKKRQMMEGTELPNQDKIRKGNERKKNTAGEWGNYSKSNYIAEISSKV